MNRNRKLKIVTGILALALLLSPVLSGGVAHLAYAARVAPGGGSGSSSGDTGSGSSNKSSDTSGDTNGQCQDNTQSGKGKVVPCETVPNCPDPAGIDPSKLSDKQKKLLEQDCGYAANSFGDIGSGDLMQKYVNPAITLLAILVGVVVTASIIVGAIQFSSSAGDPQKAAAAKSRITGAIVALVVFMFLYAFLEFLIPGGFLNNG